MSLRESYYQQILAGEKKYEYRTRFLKEKSTAYIYISKSIKKVVAIIEFGVPIYGSDKEIAAIAETEKEGNYEIFLEWLNGKKCYAVPIERIKAIEPVSLDELRQKFPDFVVPQSYYCLNKKRELLQFLQSRSVLSSKNNPTANEINKTFEFVKSDMNTIALLKETIPNERRVLLLPCDVERLSREFTILVESGAGENIGVSDDEYKVAGATIVPKEKAWCADLIIKYKAPTSEEYKYLKRVKAIGAIFHAEGNYKLIRALLESKSTAYTYEFIESEDKIFPMAFSGGEIAGKMAILYACFFQQIQYGGKGKALFAVRGCQKPKIAIIGYGNVCGAAIKLASDLGNDVYVFGTNINKLKKQSVNFNEFVHCYEATSENLTMLLPEMDAIIGGILISTYDTEPVISHEIMSILKRGTVIIDVTCGYGPGYIPDIDKYTTLEEPIYINNNGIVCCKIDNLPSAYPLTTTEAYSKNGVEWIEKLARHVFGQQFYKEIENGKITENGEITHPVIKEHWEYYSAHGNDLS